MSEQTTKKQIAREYYNVIYGAKLNLASLDICEKLPSVISLLSLSLGILGLSFETFNNKSLASFLLIAGLVGLMLKPREMQKDKYCKAGNELTDISKKLELLHSDIEPSEPESEAAGRVELRKLQTEHKEVYQPSPVFLASWYAHYKLFSEHNNKWFCIELGLTWKDKIPLSLRSTILAAIIAMLIYINPFCFFSKTWDWIEEPCVDGCWKEQALIQEEDNTPGLSLNNEEVTTQQATQLSK